MSGVSLSSRGVVHAVELNGVRFDVEYDPDLPERGITLYHPRRVVKLRAWDSEVFLHECIHIAFAVVSDRAAWWGTGFNGDKRINDDEQEAFVQHLSHFLYDAGFRIAQKGDSTSG